MEHKKKAIIISAFAIVAFIFVTVVYLFTPMGEKMPFGKNAGLEKKADMCTYDSDDDAYVYATNNDVVDVCSCIQDDAKGESCKELIMINESYKQAIAQYDPTICENISMQDLRDSCKMATEDAVAFMKKNDPLKLANIYKYSQDDGAIEAFESLIASDPKNIEHYLNLAVVYAEKGLWEQEQGRDRIPYLEKAFRTTDKAKEIDRQNSEVYRIEGYINEIKPDLPAALTSYDKAVELDRGNILALVGRAHVYQMQGALQASLDDLKKAAELDKEKETVVIYSRLCNLQSSRTDLTADAKKDCILVTKLKSEDVVSKSMAYQVLGDLYMRENQFSEGISYLMQAKSLTPNDPSIYVSMANIKIAQKKYAEAEDSARQAIDMNANKASGYLSLSKALLLQKKYDDAIAMALKGVELVCDDVSLLDPNKSKYKKDLYYVVSAAYNAKGDKENEIKYEEMGNASVESNN